MELIKICEPESNLSYFDRFLHSDLYGVQIFAEYVSNHLRFNNLDGKDFLSLFDPTSKWFVVCLDKGSLNDISNYAYVAYSLSELSTKVPRIILKGFVTRSELMILRDMIREFNPLSDIIVASGYVLSREEKEAGHFRTYSLLNYSDLVLKQISSSIKNKENVLLKDYDLIEGLKRVIEETECSDNLYVLTKKPYEVSSMVRNMKKVK